MNTQDSDHGKRGGTIQSALYRAVTVARLFSRPPVKTSKLQTRRRVEPKSVSKSRMNTQRIHSPSFQTGTQPRIIQPAIQSNSRKRNPFGRSTKTTSTSLPKNPPIPPNNPPKFPPVMFDCDVPKKTNSRKVIPDCDKKNDSIRKVIIRFLREVLRKVAKIIFDEFVKKPLILTDPIKFMITHYRELVINTMIETLDAKDHKTLIHFLKNVCLSMKFSEHSMMIIVSHRIVTIQLGEKEIRTLDQTIIRTLNEILLKENKEFINKVKVRVQKLIVKRLKQNEFSTASQSVETNV